MEVAIAMFNTRKSSLLLHLLGSIQPMNSQALCARDASCGREKQFGHIFVEKQPAR
jgi:hypothetical protein